MVILEVVMTKQYNKKLKMKLIIVKIEVLVNISRIKLIRISESDRFSM